MRFATLWRPFVVFLILGGIFTASASTSRSLVPSRYEASFPDDRENEVRLIIPASRQGVEVFVNEQRQRFSGDVLAVALPDNQNLSEINPSLIEHISFDRVGRSTAVIAVGSNLVLVHRGRVRQIPFSDLAETNPKPQVEISSPAYTGSGPRVSFIRLKSDSVDVLRTFMLYGDRLYEVSGYTQNGPVTQVNFNHGSSVAVLNGVRCSLREVLTSIDSYRSRERVDIAARVDRLLNRPGIAELSLTTGTGGGQTPLKEFIESNFDVVRSVEVQGESYSPLANELERASAGLTMRQGGGVRILGRPGSGKTFFSDLLVSYIYAAPVSEELKDKLYIRLDSASLIGGAGVIGPTENKILALKLLSRIVPVVLLIDEMHTLVGAGAHSRNANDFFQQIKTELASGQIKIIGTTTDGEWNRNFSHDQALVDRFPVAIQINEPARETTLQILRTFLNTRYKGVSFTVQESELAEIYSLSAQFDALGANPRRAIRLTDFIVARGVAARRTSLRPGEILQLASEFYGFDLSNFSQASLRTNLSRLRAHLDTNLAGLNQAKSAIGEVLADHFLHQVRGTRTNPTAVLLYGDRGSGKTAFATQVARGIGFAFKRMMMANYGVIGGGDDFKAAIAMAIRTNPFQVILLDEIEKAPQAVQQVLLQILDEGRFEARLSEDRSQMGMTEVDASKVVFIGATNAGRSLAGNPAATAEQFEQAAESEGLNRYVIDRFSAFLPMQTPHGEDLRNILRLKLQLTRERFQASGYTLALDESAVIEFLLHQVSEQGSPVRPGIGFGDRTQTRPESAISVRRLEREITALERRISQYILANEAALTVRVVPGRDGLELRGGDACEVGFITRRQAG